MAHTKAWKKLEAKEKHAIGEIKEGLKQLESVEKQEKKLAKKIKKMHK